jgi:hypothetical protein
MRSTDIAGETLWRGREGVGGSGAVGVASIETGPTENALIVGSVKSTSNPKALT